MIKYANISLLILLICGAFLFKESIQLSTNLLSLFSSKETQAKLEIASQLGYTKELLIAVKGFDTQAKQDLDAITKSLEKLPSIQKVYSKAHNSKELQNYFLQYRPLLAPFSQKNLTALQIQAKLQKLHQEQTQSFFYTPIDSYDPLDLFDFSTTQKGFETQGEYIVLKDYGYLIYAQTNILPSDIDAARSAYKEIHTLLKDYPQTRSFAGFYYTVENSKMIKEDITIIALLSSLLLLVLYLVLLRNLKLLSHTLLALASSALFATLVSNYYFEQFHIISLAFGVSISALSIDYLFHYYFHRFYQQKYLLDLNVLYGYLTTALAFLLLSFISVPLIAQISFFAFVSLSFSYLLFTFLFPYLNFSNDTKKVIVDKKFAFLSTPMATLLALGLFVYSAFTFSFDTNIRNLDYQNTALMQTQKFFEQKLDTQLTPVIVQADSQDQLMQALHHIKQTQEKSLSFASFVLTKEECYARQNALHSYDFATLKQTLNKVALDLGFRQNYFQSSYTQFQDLHLCDQEIDLNIFAPYKLALLHKDKHLYTLAFVKDPLLATKLPYVSSLDTSAMFAKISEQFLAQIEIFGLVVGAMILFFIAMSVKKRFFYAINYILLPLSFTLAILSTFYEVNIMHLFALILLIALGIDYGIYMANTRNSGATMRAINYSLMSTFAAFGVLIFSSMTALHSIGFVITLGSALLFLLTKVLK